MREKETEKQNKLYKKYQKHRTKMRIKNLLLIFISLLNYNINAQKITQTYTTQSEKWIKEKILISKKSNEKADISINSTERLQQIDGFGACFNELGWEALLSIEEKERKKIITDLFSKEGLNFTFCRMPLGSNDYSLSYYSYNDVAEDFEMNNFNIDRDRYILIPYIKEAKKINPNLKLWASPWSPPSWMKVNNHYAMGISNVKQMAKGKEIKNNATAFKMEERYLEAYSLYFLKFIEAYKKEGIDISLIQVQNEPIYQPHWQSCTWRPEDLAYFIGNFLGPKLEATDLKTQIWLGTVNSGDPNYTRRILDQKEAAKYIKGIGFQWDAKNVIGTIHKEYPNYSLMQTESECGNGENNWKSAEYTWSLIHQYISNGASSYMYWNMVLDNSGKSTWGWTQNMMISINKETKDIKYNPEYYLMKHLSHFVLNGAHLLKTESTKDYLAFINPDGEIVIMLMNLEENDKDLKLSVNNKIVTVKAKGKSINTFSWKE